MTTSRDELDGATAPFDYDELLGRCVGRIDFVVKVLDNFANFLPSQVAQLEAAAAQPDHAKLRTLAHQLKGGALTIAAHRLGKLAHKLETVAEEGSPTNIEQCLHDLREEANRLTTTIRTRLKKE